MKLANGTFELETPRDRNGSFEPELVKRIKLIASVDGLKGFPDTEVQLCIVHQIRNSLKYVASKNQKQFANELKKVYQAFTEEEARSELDKLEDINEVKNIL